MENKELIEKLNMLDELLSMRESKREALRRIDSLIKQGIETIKQLPDRWYVRNPNEKVFQYLEKKYNRHILRYEGANIGLGELHGEFAFVPHDVDYSWGITQEEFDLAISLMSKEQ